MNKDLIAKLLGIGLILAAVFFGKIWRPNAEDAKYNAHPNATRMIRIAITAEAFDALAATLPLGSIGFERHPADDGQLLVWAASRQQAARPARPRRELQRRDPAAGRDRGALGTPLAPALL